MNVSARVQGRGVPAPAGAGPGGGSYLRLRARPGGACGRLLGAPRALPQRLQAANSRPAGLCSSMQLACWDCHLMQSLRKLRACHSQAAHKTCQHPFLFQLAEVCGLRSAHRSMCTPSGACQCARLILPPPRGILCHAGVHVCRAGTACKGTPAAQ